MRHGADAPDEALTQQIRRRPIPRLPGSLDPSARVDGGTEVMSLDELMDLASSSPAPPAPPVIEEPSAPQGAIAPPAADISPRAATAAPAPAVAAPAMGTAPAGPDVRERLFSDARQAYLGAIDRGGDWLRTGDNGLIAATAAIVLLLLVVIAAV